MVEMAKMVNPDCSQSFRDLATLVLRGVSRSLFTSWIVARPKPKDFVMLTFRLFEVNSYPVKHIFQFQQKMALESKNEVMLCKLFFTTFIGSTLIWFR